METNSSEIDRKYSPKNWSDVLNHVHAAYTMDCPTICGYAKKFGHKSAAAWILIQLTAIYGASNNREVAVAAGMISFAEAFAAQTGGFRLTELMMFFARYKAGKYESSYSSFDPKRIGNAFWKEFVPERNLELATIHRQQEQERVMKDRFTAPVGYTPLSLYKTLRGYASAGDERAAAILSNPNATTEEITEYLKSKEK